MNKYRVQVFRIFVLLILDLLLIIWISNSIVQDNNKK